VSEPIDGGCGKIKGHDNTWKVAGDEMHISAKVEVIAVDGVMLKVVARD